MTELIKQKIKQIFTIKSVSNIWKLTEGFRYLTSVCMPENHYSGTVLPGTSHRRSLKLSAPYQQTFPRFGKEHITWLVLLPYLILFSNQSTPASWSTREPFGAGCGWRCVISCDTTGISSLKPHARGHWQTYHHRCKTNSSRDRGLAASWASRSVRHHQSPSPALPFFF